METNIIMSTQKKFLVSWARRIAETKKKDLLEVADKEDTAGFIDIYCDALKQLHEKIGMPDKDAIEVISQNKKTLEPVADAFLPRAGDCQEQVAEVFAHSLVGAITGSQKAVATHIEAAIPLCKGVVDHMKSLDRAETETDRDHAKAALFLLVDALADKLFGNIMFDTTEGMPESVRSQRRELAIQAAITVVEAIEQKT